jgi:hypothetical protein
MNTQPPRLSLFMILEARLERHFICSSLRCRGYFDDAGHSTGDLQRLKDDPDHVDGRRWIPLLVAEIERLRELLKDLKN